jgi:hypothetical protein
MAESMEKSASILDAKSAQRPQSNEAANTESNDPRNFEREVHTWNPTLPMWRRSNKE